MTDKRKTCTRKDIRFNNELLAEIDKIRGDMPFGTWVQAACKKALGQGTHLGTHQEKKKVHTKGTHLNGNDYASQHGLPSNVTAEIHQQIHALGSLGQRQIAEQVGVSKSSVARAQKVPLPTE